MEWFWPLLTIFGNFLGIFAEKESRNTIRIVESVHLAYNQNWNWNHLATIEKNKNWNHNCLRQTKNNQNWNQNCLAPPENNQNWNQNCLEVIEKESVQNWIV